MKWLLNHYFLGPMVKIDGAASLKRWAAYFDRDPELIRQAVLKAGPNVLYVRRWLSRH